MESNQHNLFCPICKSSALSANKQSFNNTNALIGNMAFGTKGLVYGLAGTGKVTITCLACGYEFKPGEGATEVDFDQKHTLALSKIEKIKSIRQNKRIVAIVFLVLMLLFIWWLFSLFTR